MPRLSGSQHAKMYAQLHSMRLGASRLGYTSPRIFVSVAGVARKLNIEHESLEVEEQLNELPNTGSYTAHGFTPSKGQDVVVTLGSPNNRTRLFAGKTINTSDEVQPDLAVFTKAALIDPTWKLQRRKVLKRYLSTSVSDILIDLVTTYSPNISTRWVMRNLPVLDEITFTFEDLPDAVSRVMTRIGGYWYVDYDSCMHAFTGEESQSNPADLTDANPPASFTHEDDLNPVVTRAIVEGNGSTAAADANPGDTLLAIDDVTYFNSEGGEVRSGAQRVTYTGLGVALTHNSTWIARTKPSSRTWRGICWSPDKGVFVAVGDDGAGGSSNAIVSSDGITWTYQTMPAASSYWGVCWSSDRALFVAVGITGAIATSPDGVTWTARSGGGTGTFRSVVWSPNLSLFVAVASGGSVTVATSPDGVTWTSRTPAEANPWWGVTWAPALGLFVATAASGVHSVMTSPDGITWTARSVPEGNQWLTVCWSPELSRLVSVSFDGTHRVMTSPDGITWTARTAAESAGWFNVTWSPGEGRFVAVAQTTGDNRVMSSPDGITWTVEAQATSGEWFAVAWSPTLFRYAAVGVTVIMTSESQDQTPTLTGIPATGPGSIVNAIVAGDEVNLIVFEDADESFAEDMDEYAVDQLIGLLNEPGFDGYIESETQDRRLSETESRALAHATLTTYKNPLVTIHYQTIDRRTRVGRTVDVDFNGIVGTFKLQRVLISGAQTGDDQPYPLYQVDASSQRFSFEDLLRRIPRTT